MTEKEIYEYLRMERLSEEDVKNLAAAVNVKPYIYKANIFL
jgi:hypothetical protein